ncbi:hypothetical protein [Soonwooa purpurea]
MRKVLTNEIRNERCNAAALGLFNASVGSETSIESVEKDPYQLTEKEEERFQIIWKRISPTIRRVYKLSEELARQRFVRKTLNK